MNFLGRPKGSTNKKTKKQIQVEEPEMAWGATKILKTNLITTYDNKSMTYKGEIKGFNYDMILRDKQKYIYDLFSLSDYFVDKDQIYRGIIKNVYVPFSLSNGWKLVGSSEKTKKKFLDFYKTIGLADMMRSIFFQIYKYENVYVYVGDDGKMMTLPVNKIQIADVTINGEPVLNFNVQELKNATSSKTAVKEDFIKTLVDKYEGYPKEVTDGIKKGSGQWIQLNPENTFCLQGLKEDWVRYAIPMVSACLEPFSKKALISNYENSLLSLGMRGFLHVKVGDKDWQKAVNQQALDANVEIFKNALSGLPLAVTNWMVDAEWKSVDTKQLFDKNKYTEVNNDILAAGGISAIVVSGNSQGSTSFASAQVSVQTAAERIKQSTDNFAEMMNKINVKLAGVIGATANKIPEFKFNDVDLARDGKFREACFDLWKQGLLSTKSLHEEYSLDHEQELERKKEEQKEGYSDIFSPPSNPFTQSKNSDPESKPGAPVKDIKDSKTDKNNSVSNPKPSDE